MSNTDLSTPADIDLGKHRIPDAVRRKNELLKYAELSTPSREEVNEDPIMETFSGTVKSESNYSKASTSLDNKEDNKLPISGFTVDFIKRHPMETENLISWYSGIVSQRGGKNKLMLGIPGFPFKVKINPLLVKKEENYLSVFVKADNSLEISLPVASEVILSGEVNGEALTDTNGMFLGEVTFDKNFLFKILIFVVK